MMEGWKKLKIDDLCSKITDGAHFSPPELKGGRLMASSKDMTDFGWDFSSIKEIPEDDYWKLVKGDCKPLLNDVLIIKDGNNYLKHTFVVKKEVDLVILSSVAILRPDTSVVFPLFFQYLLRDPHIHGLMASYVSGAAIPRVVISDFKKVEVTLPDYSVQKKIAFILSAYDNLIENNNQRIKLLGEMAEEIYEEWFVRLRFPGYQYSNFLDKDGNEVGHDTVGSLPEGWEMKKLRDCLSHYIGGGWGEESSKGKNIVPAHVIRGTDIPKFNKGQLNFDVLRFHSKSNFSSRVCQPLDIIFEVSGGTEDQSLGRTSFITNEALNRFGDPVIAASFCKLIRVDSAVISPFYINSLLNRMYSTNELMVFQVQSTGISNYQFEDFIDSTKVKVPNVDIQNQFDDLISPMLDEVQILGAKNKVLQETRDLLLPRLISGKLSVEELNL